VAKDFAPEAPDHVKTLAIILPIQLRVFALPALVPRFKTSVTLPVDARVVDPGFTAEYREPLRNVFLELDVNQDSINFQAVRVRANSRTEIRIVQKPLILAY
jgi:hypothetical protein